MVSHKDPELQRFHSLGGLDGELWSIPKYLLPRAELRIANSTAWSLRRIDFGDQKIEFIRMMEGMSLLRCLSVLQCGIKSVVQRRLIDLSRGPSSPSNPTDLPSCVSHFGEQASQSFLRRADKACSIKFLR